MYWQFSVLSCLRICTRTCVLNSAVDSSDYCVRWLGSGPSGLRRGSAADRLLGLRVRIPPGGHGCLCCVVSKNKKTKCRTIKTKERSKDEAQRSKKDTKKNLWGYGCPSVVQVAASATSWSLVKRSHTGWVCLIVCDQGTSDGGGLGASWAVAPQKERKYWIMRRNELESMLNYVVVV